MIIQFCRKCSILEVSLGSKYTLSVAMLLDRFGQSNKFWKKSYKKYWNIQVWVLWRSSKGRSENVLGTSRINLLRKSLERQIRTSPGHHFRTPQDIILGRSRDIRSGCPRDGQIGSLGDVLGTLEGDVFGTSWWPIFAGWVTSADFHEYGITAKIKMWRSVTHAKTGIIESTRIYQTM